MATKNELALEALRAIAQRKIHIQCLESEWGDESVSCLAQDPCLACLARKAITPAWETIRAITLWEFDKIPCLASSPCKNNLCPLCRVKEVLADLEDRRYE